MAIFGKVGGGTGFDAGNGGIYTCRYQAPENGKVSEITVYLYWGYIPSGLVPVVYSDVNGSLGQLLAKGAPVQYQENAENRMPIIFDIVGGAHYHIGVQTEGPTYMLVDTGEINQMRFGAMGSYPNPPEQLLPSRSWDYELYIYATYVPSATVRLTYQSTPIPVIAMINGSPVPSGGYIDVPINSSVEIMAPQEVEV